MKTFTFVINANYKHCFVHQYQSEILTKDLLLKLIYDSNQISQKMKPLLVNEVIKWYDPARLKRVNNVWRDIFLVDDLTSLYNINVTKKYHEGCADYMYYKLMYFYDVKMINTDISDTMFPLSNNTSFTFITHIRNYNDVQQFNVSTLEEGLKLWADSVAVLNHQQRKILLKYIQKSKNNPIAVEGVKNVWSTSYRIFRPLLTLHIIKTVTP